MANLDPVCGIDVKDDKITRPLQGKIYYFCSTECRDEFDLTPEDYA